MDLNELTAISPIDGRYRNTTEKLADYFSESALIKYRVLLEIEYLIALSNAGLPQLKKLPEPRVSELRNIYKKFSLDNAREIKVIEKVTNHDVKAVEYFLKEKIKKTGLTSVTEFIHFGLTSQDINNTAVPLSLKDAMNDCVLPFLKEIVLILKAKAKAWEKVAMLARTHGQPASPTRLGKEIKVFIERIEKQQELLTHIPYSAKFGGATGNFNAHHVAYPKTDWVKFGNNFVNNTLGLHRSQYTTQIEHYDNLAAMLDGLKRINTILIDLNRDMWTYISMNYFKQSINKNEVGSSAMPHKVNPIDFENSEGNLGIANALFEHLSAKLPVSRLQRDLTDSTVLRNIGVPLGHCVIAYRSLLKGLGKIILNEAVLKQDLENNWAVVAEAIQTVLRREGYKNPYEKLKELTRTNAAITQKTMSKFIDTLDVSSKIKSELKQITPFNYTGV